MGHTLRAGHPEEVPGAVAAAERGRLAGGPVDPWRWSRRPSLTVHGSHEGKRAEWYVVTSDTAGFFQGVK